MNNYYLTIRSTIKVTLFAVLLLSSTFALAEDKLSVTLEQAAEDVRKSENGRVLSARTTYYNGKTEHRIKVLTPSGRVKIVKIPTFKVKSNNYQNPNDYRNNNQQSKPVNQNKRPSRYQKPSNQRPRQVKPNYQKPTPPKPNREKSGNKK